MSSRPHHRDERAQLDLFRALPGDLAPRDAQDLMAYPFFSLAKSKRLTPIDFKAGSVKIRDEIVGNNVRVKVVKNKVAPPFREVEFDIMYGEGISKLGEIIDLGVKAGVIEKSGSWFSYDSTRIGQGRENVREFLKQNPDIAASIEKAVRQSTTKIADDMLGAPEPDEGQDLEG